MDRVWATSWDECHRDFDLSDGEGGPPLGNVQLLGRVSGAILKAEMSGVPEVTWVAAGS